MSAFNNLRKKRLRLGWYALLAALWALFLVPVTSMAQANGETADLKREWVEVQQASTRSTRLQWWSELTPERLSAFIEAGVDVDIENRRRWTPIHSAARYNRDPEIIELLVAAGADVNARNKSGDTPLHWAAAENDNVAVIQVLPDSGAEVNARDKFGWTAIHTAAETTSNPDVIRVLMEAGAKPGKRAYFLLIGPRFLLNHNDNLDKDDKRRAKEYLKKRKKGQG